jgi:hypothetical protein
MAMTPGLWTISALAVELDMDRRTVAKRLRHARPAGAVRGHPAWRFTDALRALEGVRDEEDEGEEAVGGWGPEGPPPAPARPPPRGYEALARIGADDPLAYGYVLATLLLVYRLPRIVGGLAARRAGMDAGYELSREVTLVAMAEAGRIARRLRVGPWAASADPPVWDLGAAAGLDWRRLAREIGEPDWRPPHHIPGWPEIPEGEATAEAPCRRRRGLGRRP